MQTLETFIINTQTCSSLGIETMTPEAEDKTTNNCANRSSIMRFNSDHFMLFTDINYSIYLQ